jgi:hypothetical protein
VSKTQLICGLLACVSGCSYLPTISVVDDLADRETKEMVEESVWIVEAEKVRRFEDPAWPAPIQVISAQKDGVRLTGEYDIKLFDSPPTGQRIDIVYVEDGDSNECFALLSILGLSASESAWVELNGGGDNTYRCASVVINTHAELLGNNPFISASKKVELFTVGEAVISEQSQNHRYPIKIRYIND